VPLTVCPACRGRIPTSAVACIHCGRLAQRCTTCNGTGVCDHCGGVAVTGFPPCPHCGDRGKCPTCQGNKVVWPTPPP
jgi:hypothetical protein